MLASAVYDNCVIESETLVSNIIDLYSRAMSSSNDVYMKLSTVVVLNLGAVLINFRRPFRLV